MYVQPNPMSLDKPVSLAYHIAQLFDVGTEIIKADEGYELVHTDFVANEYAETYEELSTTLLRLAVLVYCGEQGWDAGYADTDPDAFARRAISFLAHSTVMFA